MSGSEKGVVAGANTPITTGIEDRETNGFTGESLELTPAEHLRLRRIIDWRILPYFSLLYLLSV